MANKKRYTVITEYKDVKTYSGFRTEEEQCNKEEVAMFASMLDDTVNSKKVVDNVSGKVIQKLR